MCEVAVAARSFMWILNMEETTKKKQTSTSQELLSCGNGVGEFADYKKLCQLFLNSVSV